jgi:hypothetical protein
MTTRESTDERKEDRSHHRDRGSTSAGELVADWGVSRVDGTALVTVRVENTSTCPRRVRLDNLLDGPLSPPRRHGVAEPGWDADGLTGVLDGGETLSVGYACQSSPETPPVAVRDGPAAPVESDPVETALRSLGDHAPPRAALRDAAVVRHDESGERRGRPIESTGDASGERPDPTPDADGHDTPAPATAPSGLDAADVSPHDTPVGRQSDRPVPTVVDAWFDAVVARLATADRLAGDVREATPTVASLGGRPGVETLASTLDDDAAALRRVAARATAIADRIDDTAVPDLRAEP